MRYAPAVLGKEQLKYNTTQDKSCQVFFDQPSEL